MAEMNTKSTEVVQPEGNYYDKYHSTNPIVKWMMKGFKDAISELLDIAGKEFCQICETGCGEGEITSFIKDMYQNAEIDAFDISEKVIAEASEKIHGINFYTGNIYTMEVRKPGEAEKHILNKGRYDLVICSEVLEHLEDPEQALKNIKELCNENGFILLVFPRNLSGEYATWQEESTGRILEIHRGISNIGPKRNFAEWLLIMI